MEKKIQSIREVKLYGVRVLVGTFDKHNPESIYLDGTISLEGTLDYYALENVKDELDAVLYQWIKNQDDYDRKRYVKLVDIPDIKTRQKPKTSRVHFDVTLLHKQPHSWKEAVEVARGHILPLYEEIVRMVLSNELRLQEFKGYNAKSDD